MSKSNAITFIEDWQTGFFGIVASVLAGYLVSIVLSHLLILNPAVIVLSFLLDSVGVFATVSYLFFQVDMNSFHRQR